MPARTHQPVFLGKTKHTLLAALGRYVFLTAEQARRLAFGKSQSYVQEHLRQLHEAGYLLRTPYLRPNEFGRAAFVYTPDLLGWRYVRELGLPTPQRLRPSEETGKGIQYMPHTLGISDVGVCLERFCRDASPLVSLVQFWHERVLPFARVELPGRVVQRLRPDAWIELHLTREGKQRQRCFLLELDRSSEYQMAFRQKVRTLLAYREEPYQRQFRTASITILFLVPNALRRKQILSWIEAELREEHQEDLADLFRVTDADPIAADKALFARPLWYVPFAPAPLPLLAPASTQATDTGDREVLRTFYLSEDQAKRFLERSKPGRRTAREVALDLDEVN